MKQQNILPKNPSKPKNKNDLKTIFLGLNNIIPNGPTNLLSALIQAAKFKPTNIYLITDGLPTFGGERFKSLNPFNQCDSIIGSSNKISGDCRVKLFNQSIKYVSTNGAKIDIILLPVEGDPQASPEMWKWASDTGGILISPAKIGHNEKKKGFRKYTFFILRCYIVWVWGYCHVGVNL